ncbi:MAG: TIGR03936 family radical SAM-associated protein, partial [Chloroflexia bacterium]
MEKPTRYYLQFARGRELRFLSHLDMMRLWERAIRRAGLPLRYSGGFHPHARISLALPLAVGMTARGEWLEVELKVP